MNTTETYTPILVGMVPTLESTIVQVSGVARGATAEVTEVWHRTSDLPMRAHVTFMCSSASMVEHCSDVRGTVEPGAIRWSSSAEGSWLQSGFPLISEQRRSEPCHPPKPRQPTSLTSVSPRSSYMPHTI